MTRVLHLREDVRRARSARRDRGYPKPARVTFPVLSAVIVISSTAVVAAALGLPLLLVLAITAAVAITGACIAHRTVGNVFAGLVLLLVRPYAPGERLVLQLREPVEAELVRVGFANTTLCSRHGLITVPNSRLLRNTR